MGVVIGWGDSDGRISPISPMPTPDNNILVALQSFASGSPTDTASKTISRVAGTNRSTKVQKNRKTKIQKDRKTKRQKDRKTEIQKDRKTERLKD
jgi:hypothetical protein